MGFYLNSRKAYELYRAEVSKRYFIDKSEILCELIPILDGGCEYICITRPRRFGKTMNANLIVSFFSKGCEASSVFENLVISRYASAMKHMNCHNVIHMMMNELPGNCDSYEQYIERIEKKLKRDLKDSYSQCCFEEDDTLWDMLTMINEQVNDKFIFVLDEWDYIFHREFIKESDKRKYLNFLSSLLKDKSYTEFVYMTGILPIVKYSSGSELNMFVEYTMVSEERFSEYFGFTESEVDLLYQRYSDDTTVQKVTREGIRTWYNGYHTKSGERVYNPRSVVVSLMNNNLGNYWTGSGPYDELFYYIEKNVDAVRDDLALMVSGFPVSAKIQEYAATSMRLQSRGEILSAMVVYGFLSYEQGCVFIPNKELMERFSDMLQKESSLGYVHQLARLSDRMLKATLSGDTDAMVEILEFAHNTETPILNYNNETELAALVNLVYLSARDRYRIEREDKAGIGYVDFIFYPEIDKKADCLILELKVDRTPDDAIAQIKDRKYDLRFRGRLGETSPYTGKILAVGISYDKNTKKHSCKIEYL